MAVEVISRGRKHLIERDPTWAPGRHRATFTIHDQHYHDGTAWQPVDESLTVDTTDGYARACTKTAHILRVGNGGTRRWYPRRNVLTEYVSITAVEYWRTSGGGSWRSLALPTPVWRAQGADWNLTNLSASLTNTWKRIKADFVLKDSTAPTRLRFAVTLTGLTLGADWKLRNGSNEVVGSIDAPTANDANGAVVPVTATYAGGYIEWGVTVGSATYPIIVDPTFTDGSGGDVFTSKDNYLTTASSGTLNYGVRANWAQPYVRALAEFDVSTIAAGSTCDAATFYCYQTAYNAGGGAAAFTLYSIASGNAAWLEGTKNAATAGAGESCHAALAADGSGGVTTAWAGSAGCSTSGTDYEADALGTLATDAEGTPNRADANGTQYHAHLTTARVAGWFGVSNTNYGLLCITAATSGPAIGSSENGTAGYRPKLVVDYTEAGGTTYFPWRSIGSGIGTGIQ